jgi:hypothetical protein
MRGLARAGEGRAAAGQRTAADSARPVTASRWSGPDRGCPAAGSWPLPGMIDERGTLSAVSTDRTPRPGATPGPGATPAPGATPVPAPLPLPAPLPVPGPLPLPAPLPLPGPLPLPAPLPLPGPLPSRRHSRPGATPAPGATPVPAPLPVPAPGFKDLGLKPALSTGFSPRSLNSHVRAGPALARARSFRHGFVDLGLAGDQPGRILLRVDPLGDFPLT